MFCILALDCSLRLGGGIDFSKDVEYPPYDVPNDELCVMRDPPGGREGGLNVLVRERGDY